MIRSGTVIILAAFFVFLAQFLSAQSVDGNDVGVVLAVRGNWKLTNPDGTSPQVIRGLKILADATLVPLSDPARIQIGMAGQKKDYSQLQGPIKFRKSDFSVISRVAEDNYLSIIGGTAVRSLTWGVFGDAAKDLANTRDASGLCAWLVPKLVLDSDDIRAARSIGFSTNSDSRDFDSVFPLTFRIVPSLVPQKIEWELLGPLTTPQKQDLPVLSSGILTRKDAGWYVPLGDLGAILDQDYLIRWNFTLADGVRKSFYSRVLIVDNTGFSEIDDALMKAIKADDDLGPLAQIVARYDENGLLVKKVALLKSLGFDAGDIW